MALRLFGKWYLVTDTSIPGDYPPQAREELVRRRLENSDLKMENAKLRFYPKATA